MHALHHFDEDPKEMPPPPDDLDEAEHFEFELGSIMVTARDRSPMTIPALPWV
jgi:hypothetical protein